MPRMLYLKDGKDKIDGHMVSFHVFADEDVNDALKEGWAMTPGEAYEPAPKPTKKRAKK